MSGSKVLVLSVDFDGCGSILCDSDYSKSLIKKATHTRAILQDYIDEKIAMGGYDKIIFLNGSTRQSITLDEYNYQKHIIQYAASMAEKHAKEGKSGKVLGILSSGLCIQEYPNYVAKMKAKDPRWEFIPFSSLDYATGFTLGTAFSERSRYLYTKDTIEALTKEGKVNANKIPLLTHQMEFIRQTYPDTNIDFCFFDDYPKKLKMKEAHQATLPGLTPPGMTLNCYQFELSKAQESASYKVETVLSHSAAARAETPILLTPKAGSPEENSTGAGAGAAVATSALGKRDNASSTPFHTAETDKTVAPAPLKRVKTGPIA